MIPENELSASFIADKTSDGENLNETFEENDEETPEDVNLDFYDEFSED